MKRLLALALLLLTAASDPPAWTRPIAPFRVVANIYYVGTEGLASYLIATPDGAILLDGTMAENVPAIEANIRSLGFKLSDVKILLNSHAHFDHAGGLAALKRDTHATMAAMAGDRWALEHGTHFGLTSYPRGTFPAVKVDRVLADGDTVELGGVRMLALATPGHTSGCTTWAMRVPTSAGIKNVVFPCSMTVAGNRLVGNTEYPAIVADFRRSFDRLGAMKADIVLTAHPEIAGVLARRGSTGVLARRGSDYLAPDLLPKLVKDARAAFAVELVTQEGASPRK